MGTGAKAVSALLWPSDLGQALQVDSYVLVGQASPLHVGLLALGPRPCLMGGDALLSLEGSRVEPSEG